MSRAHKKVPAFWWDFEHRDGTVANVIVECDDDRFPVVARIAIAGATAEPEIERAQTVIADLLAGRADPRRLAAECPC